MDLVYAPKFNITIVFNFSWALQSSQGKKKTIVIYAKSFGINKVVWRILLSYGACVLPLRKLHDQ